MRSVYLALLLVMLVTGLLYISGHNYGRETRRREAHSIVLRSNVELLKTLLREYRQKHARYPSNDEGLGALFELKESVPEDDLPPIRGKTRQEDFTDVGVLNPWGLIYIYENRLGLDPRDFTFSPASRDFSRRYSLEVDRDVFVYSVGAMLYEQECRDMRRDAFLITPIFVLSWAVLAALFLGTRKRGPIRSLGRHVADLCVVLLLAGLTLAVMPNFLERGFDPAWYPPRGLLSEHKRLLTAYSEAGAISADTLARILEREKGSMHRYLRSSG